MIKVENLGNEQVLKGFVTYRYWLNRSKDTHRFPRDKINHFFAPENCLLSFYARSYANLVLVRKLK